MGIPRGATIPGTTPAANPPTSGTNRNMGGMMDFASMLQQMNIVSGVLNKLE
jgi:hypothetical protein